MENSSSIVASLGYLTDREENTILLLLFTAIIYQRVYMLQYSNFW
jgi:hypothetical protein